MGGKMKFFKFVSAIIVLSLFNFSSKAVTLNAIMENVPDTLFIQELLPDFKAKTGIDVQFEIMGYGEMHPKMVPSLTASTGSIDFMPVDFYWVGEKHNLKYIVLGDCTGHGISAALLSVLMLNLFEYAIMNKGIKKTHKILQEVDKRFVESFKNSSSREIFSLVSLFTCFSDTTCTELRNNKIGKGI